MNDRPSTPEAPAPESLLQIGRIFRPHGVRGELKVAPDTDDPSRFEQLAVVYVGPHERRVTPHRVASVRYQETKRGVTVILRFEDVTDRGDAEVLAKQNVYATEEALPPLESNEVFVHDLIGLKVVTEDGEPVGSVANVLPMPAHDVYVVHRPGHPEQMIPAVEDFIVAIDLDAGRLVIRPIEGLL